MQLLRRLLYLWNRRRADAELADELEFHREMAAAEGRSFDGGLRLREESREAWGWTWLDRFQQDLRFAARLLKRSPGFTAAAILTLAIGIGVNVAAFSFFNLVMWKPLPIRDPDSLVRLQRRGPQQYWSDVPYPVMAFYREHTRTLSAVLALNFGRVALENGPAKPLGAHFVTANFFGELGARPQLGRLFDPALDETPAADPVVVLGNLFWVRHFGADPKVVGRVIRLNGKPATVIGVAAADFTGLTMSQPELWTPITRKPYFLAGSRLLTDFSGGDGGVDMWGRLREGASAQAVEAEMRMLAAELRRRAPDAIWEGETLSATAGGYAQNSGGINRSNTPPTTLQGRMMPIFAIMGTLVFLILAVACGNLGSLLMARGVAREREMSIRISVGAGRGRLIRQLITESLLLALLGAVAGCGLGYAVLRAVMAWTDAPAWMNAAPDARVMLFALALGLAAALLFGLAPALQVTRRATRDRSAPAMRQWLIAAQVAGSCVLMIVAGLLVRAMQQGVSASPGFEYEQVVSIDPRLAVHGYSPAAARGYFETLAGRLRNLPGVESVSITATPPLGSRHTNIALERAEGEQSSISASLHRVDVQFFETMRVALQAGRGFRPGDESAVIVSDSLARLRWPGRNPLEQPLEIGGTRFTVIGVVASARLINPEDSDALELYQFLGSSDVTSASVIMRTAGPPEGLTPFAASIARAIDPNLTPEVETLKTAFRRKLETTERTATAVSVMGAIALLLACLGLAGTVAYAVSQRTKEMGIRVALGARPPELVSALLGRFLLPVAGGLAAGIAGAAILSQFLRSQLYGLSHLDPAAYAGAILSFGVGAALAVAFPVSRAWRVSPIRALRAE